VQKRMELREAAFGTAHSEGLTFNSRNALVGAARDIDSNLWRIYHMNNRMQAKSEVPKHFCGLGGFRFLYRAIAALALCALGAAISLAAPTWQEESDRLATVLNWHEGSSVGEVGAGDGELTLLAAKRVGASGKVYTTELDAGKLAHLQELAAKNKNIQAIKAGDDSTNLPEGCCDSIYMRLVYHHLTKPAEIDASLLRALKPGGRLAVIEREPPKGSSLVSGVPKNREGHGIPQRVLINELKTAGFEVVTVQNDWPGSSEGQQLYCVVVKKSGG